MTDNEQGYTPTDEQVERLARAFFAHTKEGRDGFSWPLNGEKDRERDIEEARRILIRVLGPDFLAAHRVTLVADSREALAKTIALHFNGWLVEKGHKESLATELALEAVDEALDGGVVQVITPTEMDDAIKHASNMERIADCIKHQTWGAHAENEANARAAAQYLTALASRPAPVAPPTEEVEQTKPDPLGAKSPDDCTHWKVGRSFGSTHGVCHSCGSQIEYDEVSPLSIIEVKPPVVPVDALGFPTQEGATFSALLDGTQTRLSFTVRRGASEPFKSESGLGYTARALDPASIEDVRPADGRGAQ